MLLARCLLDQLKANEITEDDRRIQMRLYKSFPPTSAQRNNRLRTDATRRNKTSRRKNRAQRESSESGDAVFDGRQLLTPTKSFYVRNHFPIPAIDRNAWWLHVEGEVEKPFAINYEQLMTLKSLTAPLTLECAGNNRNFLEPKVKGVQWHLGAVSTAEWTGVPLSLLLDRATLKPNACEVILEGADRGMLEDPHSPPGELKFARSIPLEKARRDVLLAYK